MAQLGMFHDAKLLASPLKVTSVESFSGDEIEATKLKVVDALEVGVKTKNWCEDRFAFRYVVRETEV